jgi:hypothetical protein
MEIAVKYPTTAQPDQHHTGKDRRRRHIPGAEAAASPRTTQ